MRDVHSQRIFVVSEYYYTCGIHIVVYDNCMEAALVLLCLISLIFIVGISSITISIFNHQRHYPSVKKEEIPEVPKARMELSDFDDFNFEVLRE